MTTQQMLAAAFREMARVAETLPDTPSHTRPVCIDDMFDAFVDTSVEYAMRVNLGSEDDYGWMCLVCRDVEGHTADCPIGYVEAVVQKRAVGHLSIGRGE